MAWASAFAIDDFLGLERQYNFEKGGKQFCILFARGLPGYPTWLVENLPLAARKDYVVVTIRDGELYERDFYTTRLEAEAEFIKKVEKQDNKTLKKLGENFNKYKTWRQYYERYRAGED